MIWILTNGLHQSWVIYSDFNNQVSFTDSCKEPIYHFDWLVGICTTTAALKPKSLCEDWWLTSVQTQPLVRSVKLSCKHCESFWQPILEHKFDKQENIPVTMIDIFGAHKNPSRLFLDVLWRIWELKSKTVSRRSLWQGNFWMVYDVIIMLPSFWWQWTPSYIDDEFVCKCANTHRHRRV